MDGPEPELRLADGQLELGPAVCVVRRDGAVEELTGAGWHADGTDLISSAGGIDIRLRVLPGDRFDELSLTASTTADVEVITVGASFRPVLGGEAPAWLLYEGYQSWDAAGVAALAPESAAINSTWRCGLADAGGAGIALLARSADRHITRFDVTDHEVRWLQAAPHLGDREQPVWRSRETPELRSETLRVAAGADVRRLLREHLPQLARTPSPAPRGWLSWYHLGIWVDAAAVLGNAERLSADLSPAVVQIDDGWQLSYGDWDPNTKFPDLAELCGELRGNGQVPGIWTAPFLVSAGADLATTAPETWFLHDPKSGERLVDPRHTVFGPMYVLDPRQTEVRAHLAELFARLRDLGFQHFKIDFLYAGAFAGIEAFRRGLKAIRQGAGEDAYLLACGAPLLPVAGLADGCRIGPDTCTPWLDFATGEPQPTFFGDEVVNVIRNVAARSDLGPWFHTDPDVALAGGTIGAARARQLITAVALCGGLYFLSDDLRVLAPERLALVASPELAEIAAGGPAVPDWDPNRRDLPPTVWRRGDGLVAIFNFGGAPAKHAVEAPAGATVRDVWAGEDLASGGGTLDLEVEPEGVRLIRFDAARL